jgi:tetratricopeptide (TPR) repeat protein
MIKRWICICIVSAGASAWGASGAVSEQIADRIRGMSPEEKVAYLTEAKASGEESAEINFLLGNTFYEMGEIDSAIVCFRRAVAIDSTFSKGYVNLGIALDSRRKYSEAKAMYRRALRVNPKDVLAYCHLGYLAYSRGRVDEAVENYKKALELDPNSAQAHYNLGLAFADARIFKEALREWELVAKLDPDGELGKTASENVGLIKQYMEIDTE